MKKIFIKKAFNRSHSEESLYRILVQKNSGQIPGKQLRIRFFVREAGQKFSAVTKKYSCICGFLRNASAMLNPFLLSFLLCFP